MGEGYYNLKFLTDENKAATIRVPKAILVGSDIVKQAMLKIIGTDAVVVTAGALRSIDSAEFVQTTTQDCTV